jgi:EAL domain-containing protein (putative c-di-GMP-specific phosphodiesterase class I)
MGKNSRPLIYRILNITRSAFFVGRAKAKFAMIKIVSINEDLAARVSSLLKIHGVESSLTKPGTKESVASIYDLQITAVVVDHRMPNIPEHAWFDLLASLGKRIPVLILMSGSDRSDTKAPDTATCLIDPSAEEVVSVLDTVGAVGGEYRKVNRSAIAAFNPQVPLHMLKKSGSLSVLLVDASSFRKIGIEYGAEAYIRMQECFNHLLMEIWGSPGSFRGSDVLCRRAAHSNIYYIFLEQSRRSNTIPAPGILERLADRLVVKLHNAFWKEIFLDKTKRMVPECIGIVPDLAVGFSTSINNPCVDTLELVEQMLDSAQEESRIQLRRMKERQKELMQTLIHTPGLLEPHYQAVFDLKTVTKEEVEEAKATKSILPLKQHLYGFESLIRVKKEALENLFDANNPGFLESRFLRPDVLFALSHLAKVGLELDQACLAQAINHSMNLPGVLMMNILPRNLYNVDKLQHLLGERQNLMFEVSESEAINNFDLMMKVRGNLEKMKMRIATDDFGKGYSGLEQVIKIKPDLIKLDRSLIQDIHLDPPKRAFLQGLVTAAKISSSTILAEGVELWEEAQILKDMGIDLIQGFLLHRPQAAPFIELDLQKQPPKLSSVA